jgi:hypothetical protein
MKPNRANVAPRLTRVADLERDRARQLADERRKRPGWYWLSFVNRTGFLGGAILWAHGVETAVLRARKLNISSGFRGNVEIFCESIPARIMKERVPTDLRNRLLSEREVLMRLDGKHIGDY